MTEIKFREFENLILNMESGLLPENLTKKEVSLLEKNLGLDWFQNLGYYEPYYKKPNITQWNATSLTR